ncbi:putative kinase Y4mE [Actinomycetota bacterium]|nr:putative kinase Y4mE [Actinomycetota bacterium]
MTGLLQLWLRGEHLGELEQLRTGRLRLRYSTEALDTYGVGARPLSLSLPLTDRRVQGDVLERFLDNLLPEGAVRAALERENGIRPGDTFALLTVVGRECAGAVQLTADDAAPGPGRLIPLTDAEAGALVSGLPSLEPPEGQVVSASLGGMQAKVLLTRTSEGWAWPAEGALSTHIIKPEPVNDIVLPELVRWEEWALRLARGAGVPAAHAELADFDGRTAIVVERFDRVGGERVHQEDFAQALGISARDKYESSATGHTRLLAIAQDAAAEAVVPSSLVVDELTQVAFNLVVGNGDAHSKNYSLAISPTASYSMTPMYDVAPVYLLNSIYQHFGHVVDGQARLRHLTGAHLGREAERWGLPAGRARDVIADVAERVRAAVGSCAGQGIDVERVAEEVAARAGGVLDALVGDG